MAFTFPPDVAVLDFTSILHARLESGKRGPMITHAKRYLLPPDVFEAGPVTPGLSMEVPIAEIVRRMKLEAGKLDRISLLLPDSWFRINILELDTLPDRRAEADKLVRWSLKRTLPIEADALRLVYQTISRSSTRVKLLVLAAVEKTLAKIETAFSAAGVEVVLIEPVGINIWNAITAREQVTQRDRIFLYIDESEFTTALFRGPVPLFIRSRNLAGDRSVSQDLKLSANYLRSNFQIESLENIYVAANDLPQETLDTIGSEFGFPVKRVAVTDYAELNASGDAIPHSAELTACSGVFSA